MIFCSALIKIINESDIIPLTEGMCLSNQGFQFQVVLDRRKRCNEKINVSGRLSGFCTAYRVLNMHGEYDHPLNKKTDDYYIKADDGEYPDLLREVTVLTTEPDEECILLIDISEREKPQGEHTLEIEIGEERGEIKIGVSDKKLVETDLILTNWLHHDCICNYYNVRPYSQEFYQRMDWFLSSYARMGNTMILLPAFTPPLDTEVGGERLTTQLVKVKKQNGVYFFDFSEMKKFILLCEQKGIKYFEHSHLFTQWGGEYCPKIIVEENGEEYNAFGWSVCSEDERYTDFLKAYLPALWEFVKQEGLTDRFYLHLTDEPRPMHIEKYKRLSRLVKKYCGELKTIDALSEKSVAEQVDMPVVAMNSKDLPLFDENKMLYYCVEVDNDGITNRFFNMLLQRTEILGFQLYENAAKGFLHWGYNFYNTQLSKAQVNPYYDASAGGGFPAGDSFLVYPGTKNIEFSVRYFSIKRAFEDYRLLKTAEEKLGKEKTLEVLRAEGVSGVHKYPRSALWHQSFREKIVKLMN